jgi:prophage regulatory protein
MSDLDALLPLSVVMNAANRGRSQIYADEAAGLFPQRIKCGRSTSWLRSEIATYIAARAAGISEAELRVLVRDMTTARLQRYKNDNSHLIGAAL